MQVFIQSVDGRTITCAITEGATFSELMNYLARVTQVPVAEMCLSWGVHRYSEDSIISPVLANRTLVLSARLSGGAKYKRLDPYLQALAEKYNVAKKICRKCYARLAPKAHNCRKRKCGHCNDLRPKKVSKDPKPR
ncbi:ubiquitin-60S ribosomal protein L40-like [Tropilaelaps mercedesae]|uniref:Ubiquitin-ribosomal protein eL40 fusion protein n=1 Tax=Tropilaelaps mercedesae TaxID=418985 RepID=A0A1V9XC39_9ACAR|nr:ubiquitin-60S ribosomal protein L40-like [Tropilaelaps mercedesae]